MLLSFCMSLPCILMASCLLGGSLVKQSWLALAVARKAELSTLGHAVSQEAELLAARSRLLLRTSLVTYLRAKLQLLLHLLAMKSWSWYAQYEHKPLRPSNRCHIHRCEPSCDLLGSKESFGLLLGSLDCSLARHRACMCLQFGSRPAIRTQFNV